MAGDFLSTVSMGSKHMHLMNKRIVDYNLNQYIFSCTKTLAGVEKLVG